MNALERLETIISNAYTLALQAQDNEIDPDLADEVAGECAEFLALLDGDAGSFGDEECMDAELIALVEQLKGGK
jgi:hypothetical protein